MRKHGYVVQRCCLYVADGRQRSMSNIVAQFRESTLIDTAIPDIKYWEELKAKKAGLKKLDTELSKLEEQKAEVEAREAEEAKKTELEETIQKLMADGMSAGEILEKLK